MNKSRPARLVRDRARRRAVQLHRPGAPQDAGIAAGRGRPARSARPGGRRGLPVPWRLPRHRRARPASRREGGPALRRAGQSRPDQSHSGGRTRWVAGRVARHLWRPYRHKEAISRLPGHAVLVASSADCQRGYSGVGPNVYATQFHPNPTWPACPPGSRCTSTLATSTAAIRPQPGSRGPPVPLKRCPRLHGGQADGMKCTWGGLVPRGRPALHMLSCVSRGRSGSSETAPSWPAGRSAAGSPGRCSSCWRSNGRPLSPWTGSWRSCGRASARPRPSRTWRRWSAGSVRR